MFNYDERINNNYITPGAVMLQNVLAKAVVYDHASPFEVSHYVNQHVGNHRLQVSSDNAAASLRSMDFSDIGLSRISYGSEVQVLCPDLMGVYHFQIVTRGRCQWQFADRALELGAGQALMMNPSEQIDLNYSSDCEKLIVKVPEELVRSACLEQFGALPRCGVRFDTDVVNLTDSRAFMSFLQVVFFEADDVVNVDATRLCVSYRDLLVRKLLTTFPSNVSQQPAPASQDPQLVGILDYVAANIKADLSVEELAAMCRVSVRTVYNLFAKQLSTTPRLYIKQMKFKALHQDLLTLASVRNVTEVALDYGFTHLGRFSSDYKRIFGELPSETLKRRRL